MRVPSTIDSTGLGGRSIYDPLTADGPGRGAAHAPSYWEATAGKAPPDDGPLEAGIDADVAIIGAGYTGLSCAVHLARDHGTRPVVLEANRPVWGCSGRNGSFARPVIGRVPLSTWLDRWGEDGARALFAETFAALETVRGLIHDGAIDCDVQPDGTLRVAHSEAALRELERDWRLLEQRFGYRTELLTPEDLARDHFRSGDAHGALRSPHGFGLHPLKFGYGILRMARQAGAMVHSASPVTRWRKHEGRHVLSTPGGEVRARHIVFATNGYTPERLHPGLHGAALPVLSNIVVTRPMTRTERTACGLVTTDVIYDTRKFLNYYRRLPDERILLGNRGPIWATPQALERHRRWLLDTIKRKFPGLEELTTEYFWGGWVSITRDFMPRITHASDDASVHFAMGYCGSGVAAAPLAGRRMAERLAGDDRVLPPLAAPLPHIPLASLRRLVQLATFLWYRACDARG